MPIDYDGLAAAYAGSRTAHPRVLARLCEEAEEIGAARILEVGCGTGNYIRALRRQTGAVCCGLDPSSQMLAQGDLRADGMLLALGRAEALGFGTGLFDLVFSVDVIHHVADRAAYYCEAHRLLRLGGLVCTVTDSPWVIQHREPLSRYFPETAPAELNRYPTMVRLDEAMRQAGFRALRTERVEHRYAVTDLRPYREKAYSALHLIPDAAHKAGLARMEQDLASGPISAVSRYELLWGQK